MPWDTQTLIHVAAYTGGGICMGLGAMGAAIGEGYTAAQANLAVSRNPKISGDLFKNMLVGQAVAESASIFALVIAILLLFMDTGASGLIKATALLGAGICMGCGAIGSGVGSGFPGGKACLGISELVGVDSYSKAEFLGFFNEGRCLFDAEITFLNECVHEVRK